MLQHLTQSIHLNIYNLLDIYLTQRLEHHNLVNTIQKLRFELYLKQFDYLALHTLNNLLGQSVMLLKCL